MPTYMPGCVGHPVVNAAKALHQHDHGTPFENAGMKERSWNPYQDNGGTAAMIRGKDFVVIAADTRMSRGYSIMDRHTSKIMELPGDLILVSGGMQADRNHLQKIVKHRLAWYEYKNKKTASIHAVGQMMSSMLYSRRFFPLYTYNSVAGIDAEGKAAIYAYDVVGSKESVSHSVEGSGRDLMEPALDCQIRRYNQQGLGPFDDITPEQA
eukprot:gene11980-18493_t